MDFSDQEAYQPSEEEMIAAARRNIALGILPSVIRRSHVSDTAEAVVAMAYRIADEMLKQGDK